MNWSLLIPPINVRDYAKEQGWVLDQNMAQTRRLYVMTNANFPKRQLVFPMDTNVPDYSEAVMLVAEKMAGMEKVSVEKMLDRLTAVGDDSISFRIATDRLDEDSLPLSFVSSIVTGAEQLLLASACSVLKPQAHHPRLSRTEAQSFLENSKFRHTKPGSFILQVSCPVNALDFQTPHLNEASETSELPFVRQATLALGTAVQSLITAIEADSLEGLVTSAKNGENTLVSSNLCEALARFGDESLKNSLDIVIEWAPIAPRPARFSRATTLRIQRDYFPRILEVGRELRSIGREVNDVFIGTVERLDGEMGPDGHRSGTVTLSILTSEGEQVRANADLNSDQYGMADFAHMKEGVYVLVAATLRPGRQPRQLINISEFELVTKKEPPGELPATTKLQE